MHPPEQRVEELLAIAERGFKTAKLRVKNKELKDDIRHIEVIAKGVGNRLKLAVDANQGWLVTIMEKIPAWDLKRASEFAKACGDNGIIWLEEPLDSRDYDGNAALKKISPVKIAGAELNYGWDEIKIMMEKDCFHIYQPDATFAGGIAQVMQVIEACQDNGWESHRDRSEAQGYPGKRDQDSLEHEKQERQPVGLPPDDFSSKSIPVHVGQFFF